MARPALLLTSQGISMPSSTARTPHRHPDLSQSRSCSAFTMPMRSSEYGAKGVTSKWPDKNQRNRLPSALGTLTLQSVSSQSFVAPSLDSSGVPAPRSAAPSPNTPPHRQSSPTRMARPPASSPSQRRKSPSAPPAIPLHPSLASSPIPARTPHPPHDPRSLCSSPTRSART
jgi:hypothetical protein